MIPEKMKQESAALSEAVRERTLAYIAAAFGLIAGLAWNDAVKALIEYLFPLSTNTLLESFSMRSS